MRLKAPRSLGLFLIFLGAPVLGMGQVVRKRDAWSSHPLIRGLGLPCVQETAETRSWGGRKGDDVLGGLCPLEEIEPSLDSEGPLVSRTSIWGRTFGPHSVV